MIMQNISILLLIIIIKLVCSYNINKIILNNDKISSISTSIIKSKSLLSLSSLQSPLESESLSLESPMISSKNKVQKLIAIISLSFSLSNSINIGDSIAANNLGTISALEESISRLETSESRQDVLQSMADVFEAAESKTLLTRTKYKYRIINAINKQRVALSNVWDQPLGYASGELKRRADPFRTVDLKNYLNIAPYIGGVCYLGALFVQQTLPELFIFAYPAAVFVFASPIIFTILTT